MEGSARIEKSKNELLQLNKKVDLLKSYTSPRIIIFNKKMKM